MKEVKRCKFPVINKYSECDVQHDNQHSCMLYMKVVKTVNLKNFHRNIFLFIECCCLFK